MVMDQLKSICSYDVDCIEEHGKECIEHEGSVKVFQFLFQIGQFILLKSFLNIVLLRVDVVLKQGLL